MMKKQVSTYRMVEGHLVKSSTTVDHYLSRFQGPLPAISADDPVELDKSLTTEPSLYQQIESLEESEIVTEKLNRDNLSFSQD
jgi:hypothetical protein